MRNFEERRDGAGLIARLRACTGTRPSIIVAIASVIAPITPARPRIIGSNYPPAQCRWQSPPEIAPASPPKLRRTVSESLHRLAGGTRCSLFGSGYAGGLDGVDL